MKLRLATVSCWHHGLLTPCRSCREITAHPMLRSSILRRGVCVCVCVCVLFSFSVVWAGLIPNSKRCFQTSPSSASEAVYFHVHIAWASVPTNWTQDAPFNFGRESKPAMLPAPRAHSGAAWLFASAHLLPLGVQARG